MSKTQNNKIEKSWCKVANEPIPNEIGNLIENYAKNNILDPNKREIGIEKISKTYKKQIEHELIISELEKLDDFTNSWGKLTEHEISRHENHDFNIWKDGYEKGISDIHDRISKFRLLYLIYFKLKVVQS